MKKATIFIFIIFMLIFTTPVTAGTLEYDWLFQAGFTVQMQDVRSEIDRTAQLAKRLQKLDSNLDFSKELALLDSLDDIAASPAAKTEPAKSPRFSLSQAQWICNTKVGSTDGKSWFYKTFTLGEGKFPINAKLIITCDNRWSLYINGEKAGKCPESFDAWEYPQVVDVTKQISTGKNTVTVEGVNDENGPAVLIMKMVVKLLDGEAFEIITDSSWLTSHRHQTGWSKPNFKPDSNFKPVKVLGNYGMAPWGKLTAVGAVNESDPKAKDLYLKVRAVKRKIALSNPLLDFSSILAIDNDLTYAKGNVWNHEGLYSAWEHETLHRTGQFVSGTGRLVTINGFDPDSEPSELVGEGKGFFWRPELSYDGKKVVFCMKPKDDYAFHLYEINTDGTGFKQLTFGDYDDLDPMYTPDGKIIFTTTRGNSYVRCLPSTPSPALARCDADGKNIYVISRNNEPDFLPTMLNDGRVIYTRWEYTDKALWRIQSLWTTNPDGTGTSVFWGNQSVWPDHVTEVRAIPNSEKVMFCGVGHHRWFNGCVGIIDPSKGRNYPDGLQKVTQHLVWPESGDGPGDPKLPVKYHNAGDYQAYKTPYPLSEEYFLVSASKKARRQFKFDLYLMDVYGNMELIYAAKKNVFHAIPLKSRQKPRVIPDMVQWPKIGPDQKPLTPGILYSNNVLEGTDIPKGLVKYLRVIEMDPKTYSTWLKTVQHDGPAVSPHHPETVKRILGTVPVEADGSINVKIPAGKAVYFQLLDEHYRCVQTMRSFTGVMPGEVRGCVGCHEQRDNVPTMTVPSIAQKKGPATITPPPWGTETIGYKRFVQPILDKHCGSCHQGDKNPRARKTLDMTYRESTHTFIKGRSGHRKDDKSPFTEPYLTFVSGPTPWGKDKEKISIAGAFIVEGYDWKDAASLGTLPPMSIFSYKSKLLENATSGKHHNVKIDPASRRRLTAWIDANCPYLGKEEIRQMDDPHFEHIDTLKLRPRVKTAPEINRFNIRQDGNSTAVANETMQCLDRQ